MAVFAVGFYFMAEFALLSKVDTSIGVAVITAIVVSVLIYTVVYRAKFVATVFAARQFVNHGHVKVNGRRVNISSYLVSPNDVIEVKESSRQLAVVIEASQLAERDVPDYIEVDHHKMTAKYILIPASSDVPYPVQMEPSLVVEFYSR